MSDMSNFDSPDLNWALFPDNWSTEMKLDYQQKGYNIDSAAAEANKGVNDAKNAQDSANGAQESANEANRKIDQQDITFGQHVQNESAHGVTGDNVGSGDFCSDVAGGVVLLASSVAELTAISVTVADAPTAYTQAYAQSQTDAIKTAVTAINDNIAKLNEIIAGQKTAKQMGV